MIKFLISNQIQSNLLVKDEKKYITPQEFYNRLLDKNKSLKEEIGLKLVVDFNALDDRLTDQWKSIYRKMTSQIGLWVNYIRYMIRAF